MSTHPSLTALARETIARFKGPFLNADGLLARQFPPGERTLFDNLDDLAPFLVHFGEAEFLARQADRIATRENPLLDLCASGGVLLTRNIDEWFGGWHAVYAATGSEACRSLLERSVAFVQDSLIDRDANRPFLSGAWSIPDEAAAPFRESWSAGLLECFIEMGDCFPELPGLASEVMGGWIEEPFFQRYGLFPYRVFRSAPVGFFQSRILSRRRPGASFGAGFVRPGREWIAPLLGPPEARSVVLTPGWYAQLMKSNSTPAFALLELFRHDGDRRWLDGLARWIDAALAEFCEPSPAGDSPAPVERVFMEWFPARRERRSAGVVPAAILVDVICDAFFFSRGVLDRLPAARAILEGIRLSRLRSGLLPQHEGGTACHLDAQIDAAISFRRFGELASEPGHLSFAEELTRTALRVHHTREGFVTWSGTGEVPKVVVDPKYNALALKGIINLLTLGQPLFPDLHSLFKDR